MLVVTNQLKNSNHATHYIVALISKKKAPSCHYMVAYSAIHAVKKESSSWNACIHGIAWPCNAGGTVLNLIKHESHLVPRALRNI